MINKFSILNGAKHFAPGIFQNLVFIPAGKDIKYFSGTTGIYPWKSDGISEEIIENVTKLSIIFVPSFVNHCLIPDEIFNGSCLISNFISIPKKVMNIHISYILNQYVLIQVNTYILVMILDLICVQNFHYLMVVWEKMSLFLELI